MFSTQMKTLFAAALLLFGSLGSLAGPIQSLPHEFDPVNSTSHVHVERRAPRSASVIFTDARDARNTIVGWFAAQSRSWHTLLVSTVATQISNIMNQRNGLLAAPLSSQIRTTHNQVAKRLDTSLYPTNDPQPPLEVNRAIDQWRNPTTNPPPAPRTVTLRDGQQVTAHLGTNNHGYPCINKYNGFEQANFLFKLLEPNTDIRLRDATLVNQQLTDLTVNMHVTCVRSSSTPPPVPPSSKINTCPTTTNVFSASVPSFETLNSCLFSTSTGTRTLLSTGLYNGMTCGSFAGEGIEAVAAYENESGVFGYHNRDLKICYAHPDRLIPMNSVKVCRDLYTDADETREGLFLIEDTPVLGGRRYSCECSDPTRRDFNTRIVCRPL